MQAGGRRFDPGHVHHYLGSKLPQLVQVWRPRPTRVFPFRHLLQEWDLMYRDGLNQTSLEHFAEEFLLLRGELLALRGKVEHIDGLVTFRVD